MKESWKFTRAFASRYLKLGKADWIISTTAAHHRLLWMHSFIDDNGRVARLMSHTMLLDILDTGGGWSVGAGSQENVQEYEALFANCDLPRGNDLDGRGSSSEEALAVLTSFFLTVCIDQVIFTETFCRQVACAPGFCFGPGGDPFRTFARQIRQHPGSRALPRRTTPRDT